MATSKKVASHRPKAGFNIYATEVRGKTEYYYTWNAKNGKVLMTSETHESLAYTRRVVRRLHEFVTVISGIDRINDHTLKVPNPAVKMIKL